MATSGLKSSSSKPRKLVSRYSILSVALCVILLWWVFRGVPVREFVDAFRAVSPWAIVASVLILWLSLPLRAIQWQWLLGTSPRVLFRTAFIGICLGYLGNLLLPARAGEAIRAYIVSRRSGISFMGVLPSIVLARLQDLPPLLVLLGLAIFLGMRGVNSIASGRDIGLAADVSFGALAVKLGLVLLAVVVFLAIFYVSRNRILRLSTAVARQMSPKLGGILESMAADVARALDAVADRRRFAAAQFLAFICWAIFSLAPLPLLLAFSLTFEEAIVTGIVLTAVTSLAFLIPVTPGAIGTFHVLCVGVLHTCVPGMRQETATAYAVVAHLVGTLGPAIPGLLIVPFSREALSAVHPAPTGPEDAISSANDDARSV